MGAVRTLDPLVVETVAHAELDGPLVVANEPPKGVVAAVVGEVRLALGVRVGNRARAHEEVASSVALHDVRVGVGVACEENGTCVGKDHRAKVGVILE